MGLNERQKNILDSFHKDPKVLKMAHDFSTFNLERTTIFRDLKFLVNSGYLVLNGKRYSVNEKSNAYLKFDLSRAPHERDVVRYNADLLGDYIPNKTFLLSDEQLSTLQTVGRVKGVKKVDDNPDVYKKTLSSLTIDFTHASSNLENVNISWLDTKSLIEFGETPEGLTQKQLMIVLNHKNAIGYLIDNKDTLLFKKLDLLNINALLMQDLLGEPSALNTLRNSVVKLQDSQYIPPDNPDLISQTFDMFCDKVSAIENPYEQAFFAMIFIPYLQPFIDGNKRTSRIVMNIPFLKNHLAPFSFSDIKGRDYLFGLLAVYERGNHSFLAETFVEAYKKSALRYRGIVDHVNDGGWLGLILG